MSNVCVCVFIFTFLFFATFYGQSLHFSEDYGNILTVDSILINNQYVSGKLIFDTGAGGTVLSKAFEHYVSEIKSGKKNDTYYGKLKQEDAVINEFQIGNLKLKNLAVSLLDLKKIAGECNTNDIVGIIGLDIITQYHWKIDFEENKLYFDKDKAFDTSGYESYKVKMKYKGDKLFSTNKANRLPVIRLHLNEKPKDFLFDTGNYGGIYIQDKQRNIKKNISLFKERLEVIGSKVSLEKSGHSILNLGDKLIKVNPVYSSLIKTSIGIGFLKHFDIVITKGFQTVSLRQKDEITIEEQPVKYGFSLGLIAGQLTVVSIYKDSPAYKSGLRALDKIKVINGKAYSDTVNCKNLDRLAGEFDKSQMKITLISGKQLTIKRVKK